MRAKTIIIIINKLPVNKDISDHLNIIKKTNFKNLKVLNNVLKVVKKR